MNELFSLCDQYEEFVSLYCTSNNFHAIYGTNLEFSKKYEEFKKNLVSGLEFCGSGKCCQVYKFDNKVIKLYVPYNEKISLLSYPTREDFEISKQYKEPCDETGWKPPLAVKHFLLCDYITKQGFAAVQKFIDCSSDARKEAYRLFGLIDPFLQRWNHIGNMGLDEGNPVYIDWD
jgi:hypothetical protein